MKRAHFLVWVILIFSRSLFAQDQTNFTQFYLNPYLINPSYVGIDGKASLSLLYRKQWATIKDAPQLANVTFHSPVSRRVSLGLSATDDQKGLLHSSGLMLTFGYNMPLSDESFFRFGLSGGISSNSVDMKRLEGFTDQALGSLLESNMSVLGNTGISFHLHTFHAGVSLPVIFQPSYVSRDAFSITEIDPFQSVILHFSNRFYFNENRNVFEPYVIYRMASGLPPQFEVAGIVHLNHVLYAGASFKQDFGISALGGVKLKNAMSLGASYTLKNSGVNELNSPTYEVSIGLLLGQRKKDTPMYSFVNTEKEKHKKIHGKSASEMLAEKRKAEELARKQQLDAAAKRKQQDELAKKQAEVNAQRQRELEKKKQEEELRKQQALAQQQQQQKQTTPVQTNTQPTQTTNPIKNTNTTSPSNAEIVRKQQEELARRQQEELARKQQEELSRKQQEELARKQQEELARKQQEELARKQQEELARKQQEELDRKQQDELARKQQEEAARKQQAELARKQQEELARKQQEELARRQQEEARRRAEEQALVQAREEQTEPETFQSTIRQDTVVVTHKPRFNHIDAAMEVLNVEVTEHNEQDEKERISRLTLHAEDPDEHHEGGSHPNSERHEFVQKGDHKAELDVADYVVAGVFKEESNAKHFADGLKKLGFKVKYGHLTEKAVWYVYLFQGSDINEARNQRDRYRKMKIFRDAWLLTVHH
jgi:type IX secretion system PorP/SprF family membrane protein